MLKNSLYGRNKKAQIEKLWHDSPCTISFMSPFSTIEKSLRFKHNNSIYSFENTKKTIPYNINQDPFQILRSFRKEIKDATKVSSQKTKYKMNLSKHKNQKMVCLQLINPHKVTKCRYKWESKNNYEIRRNIKLNKRAGSSFLSKDSKLKRNKSNMLNFNLQETKKVSKENPFSEINSNYLPDLQMKQTSSYF